MMVCIGGLRVVPERKRQQLGHGVFDQAALQALTNRSPSICSTWSTKPQAAGSELPFEGRDRGTNEIKWTAHPRRCRSVLGVARLRGILCTILGGVCGILRGGVDQ